MKTDYGHIRFFVAKRDDPVGALWECFAQNGTLLGRISWYKPWEQLCFWPRPHTTFGTDRLADIRLFLIEAERERQQ